MKQPIYLDYAATTPVDPKVAEAMGQCLTMEGVFANPASRSHIYGWQAEERVELARRHVADLLSCDSREVVWTSGATESNNTAIKGVFELLDGKGHLITSTAEHKAVIDPVKWLQKRGVEVTWLSPNSDGVISADQVREAMRDNTQLVSVMFVNNETGVINPVAEIGELCRARDVLFHVDAAQAVGKVPVDVAAIKADMLSLSAHKFYGPKGVGALYVRRVIRSRVTALIHGGGHERGLRSGTLPTHQLVGMGEAAKYASQVLPQESEEVARLRDKLWLGIADIVGIKRNGSTDHVSPAHLNVCFSGVDGESLMLQLRKLALSSGSACTSASVDPSYVLKAMGMSDRDAHSSLRLSLGRFTTEADIDFAIKYIKNTVKQIQAVV